jgi:hypothetical protein
LGLLRGRTLVLLLLLPLPLLLLVLLLLLALGPVVRVAGGGERRVRLRESMGERWHA